MPTPVRYSFSRVKPRGFCIEFANRDVVGFCVSPHMHVLLWLNKLANRLEKKVSVISHGIYALLHDAVL